MGERELCHASGLVRQGGPARIMTRHGGGADRAHVKYKVDLRDVLPGPSAVWLRQSTDAALEISSKKQTDQSQKKTRCVRLAENPTHYTCEGRVRSDTASSLNSLPLTLTAAWTESVALVL